MLDGSSRSLQQSEHPLCAWHRALLGRAFAQFVAGAALERATMVAQLAHAVRPDKKDDAAADETAANSTGEDEGMPRTSSIEAHCSGVAEQYGLTPRESEVIVLLAYGRTLSIIARDLQIAKGTARTHIENIYRKLDVHKQQELIDLVESHEA
ncbi:MAG: LuxR C-terminal-related transcriptional regulator [Gordonibacter sp.]